MITHCTGNLFKDRSNLIGIVFLIIVLCSFRSIHNSSNSSQNIKACIPCNISKAIATEKKIGSIKAKDIEKFLCTISKECESNVEFTECSNELLFKLIDLHTDEMVKAFSNIPISKRDYLLYVISHPILDYSIEDLIFKVKETKGRPDIKEMLLIALNSVKK